MITTIGHSSLRPNILAAALTSRGIKRVFDIRSHPNRTGTYSAPHMKAWLSTAGIKYISASRLGGWHERHADMANRFADKNVDVRKYEFEYPKQHVHSVREHIANPTWENQGLWDYSWYMTLSEFLESANWVMSRYGREPFSHCALLCSERLWWKCHRGMIADYMVWRGYEVWHVVDDVNYQHSLSYPQRLERYHPDIIKMWENWRDQ